MIDLEEIKMMINGNSYSAASYHDCKNLFNSLVRRIEELERSNNANKADIEKFNKKKE